MAPLLRHTTASALLLGALLAMPATTMATPDPANGAAQDAALEARVMAMAAELRCLVCQNETIAGSNAPLALDLRAQIRRQLVEGRSEAEVMAWMSARYGDFVHYRPPMDHRTVVLWWGPFALLLLGGFALWRQLRGQGAPAPASTPEQDP